MERIYLNEIKINEQCVISGWIDKLRDHKTMMFVVLKDSTGSIQVVIEKEKLPEIAKEISKCTKNSVIRLTGKAVENPCAKPNGYEFIPENVEIESIAEELPITADSSIDLRLDYRWVDLRQDKERMIFVIRTFVEAKMREFFINHGFIEIHSPKISSQCSEGGAEVFGFTYYEQKAYLTQSPQFYKQMAIAAGFDKVFEIGNIYRAEKSFTARHTAEATCCDFEIAHIKSNKEIMDLEEEWLIFVTSAVKEKYGEKIKEMFGVEVRVPEKMPRFKLSEVFEIFEKEYGIVTPEDKQNDLDPDGEKLICKYALEKCNSDFVFITDYPSEARAFYSKKYDDNPNLCMSFDLLYRGWEMNSGAVREHRYDVLKSQIEEHGVDPIKMQDYLDFFKYGCPPHGGLGLGIDRYIAKLLDLPSVKESIFIFRGPTRIKP